MENTNYIHSCALVLVDHVLCSGGERYHVYSMSHLFIFPLPQFYKSNPIASLKALMFGGPYET